MAARDASTPEEKGGADKEEGRGIDNILSSSKLSLFLLSGSRLLMKPLGLGHKLCSASNQRFFANSTHNPKEM